MKQSPRKDSTKSLARMVKFGAPGWSQSMKQELDEKGVVVVEGLLSSLESDTYRQQYYTWVTNLYPDGRWPSNMKGLITSFKVGHLEASWAIRLKAKAVFEELWGTGKLWSSIDAVAIGRPPEDGVTEFAEPGYHWLHVDQGAHKEGLHAYQGGVYLEDTDCDDWCFQAILGSHKYHQTFCKTFPNAVKMSTITDFYPFEKPGEIKWFEERGCQVKRIPAPKGSIVIWDSRTVHANIRPIKGRQHPGRWRYVAMVSMTPAVWATESDLESRRDAYKNLKMTTHWSSQDVNVLGEYDINQVNTVTELPSNARSREARLLAGDLEYDFEDGESNGPEKPKWNTGHPEGGWFSWCNIM